MATKAIAALFIAAAIALMWAISVDKPVDNCWSHYQTEDEAIRNCEVRP